MTDFFFISYSSVDGKNFAMKLADELAAGPPTIPVWLDKRSLRPGEDWDEQVVEAIKTCRGMIFVMSTDSVRPASVCKEEWVRALMYKKPVIPVLLNRDAELPFRLGSRDYINFVGSFDSAVARLRKHLAWMDSPQGQLQALKYRLSDAQRELPRAEPEQQMRIREDIAELERQIAQKHRDIENPKAAEQRVQQSIEAGLERERRPANQMDVEPKKRIINSPPAMVPAHFQNRYVETKMLAEFLKDESKQLVTIVGRGGVGKTAMVCRVLRALEHNHLPDDLGEMDVNGIVYYSATEDRKITVRDICNDLTSLLPEEVSAKLRTSYEDDRIPPGVMMSALLEAVPLGCLVLFLDSLEKMTDIQTRRLTNDGLMEAFQALLETPHHGVWKDMGVRPTQLTDSCL